MSQRTVEHSSATASVPVAPVTLPPAMSLLAALWDAVPLDALLEATGARVHEVPDEGAWFGGAAERKAGRILLVLPEGRPAWQRDHAARDLLARVLDVQLPGQEPTKVLAAA